MSLVAEKLRAALPALPRAERRVAYEILASYPTAGLETVARLAIRADVSGPTVIRLISRLGYQGFPDFQVALREEIQERSASPLQQYAKRDGDSRVNTFDATISTIQHSLSDSLKTIDTETFEAAIAALSDVRRKCSLVGGRFSSSLAQIFSQHLEILRPQTHFLPESDWVSYLMDVRKGDLVIAFDFRRYQQSTVAFGQECVRRGASLIVITDPWLSPLAMETEIALPVSVQSASPFDSQVPALALIEALIAGMVDSRGSEATDRIIDYDLLWADHGFSSISTKESK